MQRITKTSTIAVGALFSLILLNGCAKKPNQAVATPPPPREPVMAAAREENRTQAQAPQRQAEPTPQRTASRPERISAEEKAQLDSSLAKLEDALFDYDKSTIRADALKVLQEHVTVIRTTLTKYPSQMVTLEGHADERGSSEYNLALGDARAKSVKEFLVNGGVPAGQLKELSFGKERPQCTDGTEDCWQKNRRVHLFRSIQIRK